MDFVTLYNFYKYRSGTKLNAVSDELKNLGYNFKNLDEIETFTVFVETLLKDSCEGTVSKSTDYFHFGFQIPQLGKEIDFIRFGFNFNINIEYKKSATVEKRVEQLKNNHFYLNFLSVPTRYFSFVADSKDILEYIVRTGEVVKLSSEEFLEILESQEIEFTNLAAANKKFNISQYLVSPFNDVDRFLNSEYLLTQQQSTHKVEILKSDKKFFSIQGRPGTGKTLLLYDLAKTLQSQGKEVCIIHCANLNNGQIELNKRGFNIIPTKDSSSLDYNSLDYILLDESQRIWPNQRDEIIANSKEYSVKVIFFLDEEQTLSDTEENYNNKKTIKGLVKEYEGYNLKLTNKYRSNPELAKFIQLLFQFPKEHNRITKLSNLDGSIRVRYFNSYSQASDYLFNLGCSGVKVLDYTRSRYTDNEDLRNLPSIGEVSHSIIGQEFDNIAVALDSKFRYKINESGTNFILVYEGKSYYNTKKMLYQNITRTRKNIELVIINNPVLLYQLSKIVNF